MLTSLVIYLAFAALLASHVSSQPTITREIKFNTQDPYVVSIDSQLYVISKNKTHIRIDSSDKTFKTCQILSNAAENAIPGRIHAKVLESKKIVVYGVRSNSEKLMIKSVYHTILIVDPSRCEFKTLKGLIEDKVPLFFPVISAEIVARPNNQLDVFYLGPKECAPCRFDDEGNRITLNRQFISDRRTPTNLYVRELQQNGGYAYAWHLSDGSSVFKVLDRDFNVLKQISINNSLFDFSTSSNSQNSFIGITYNSPGSPYDFSYSLYNLNLQPIFTNRLESIDSGHIGLNALANVDSKGNSYVSFQQMSEEEGDSIVSFVAYDSNGKKIGNSFELIKIPNDAVYESQALLLNDREYCFVLHKLDEPFGETTIKCIDVTKGL